MEYNDPKKNLRVAQIYKTDRFDETDSSIVKKICANYKKRVKKNIKDPSFYKNILYKRIPIINWLPKYRIKEYLAPDLIAGLTVGVMNIPQGMAYSLLATLPAVNGLYIAFFPCIFYAFFGTSAHLAIGAIALVSLLSGTAISTVVTNYEYSLNITGNTTDFAHQIEQYRVTVACSLTLLVGLIQILLGISGLGILTTYFSDTFISSYTCASAIHVIKSQIKDLFGITNSIRFSGIFNIPKSLIDLLSKLPDSNWITIILSVICMIYLVIFKEHINPWIKKKIKVQFPSELLLIIVATIVSYFGNFERYGIKVVGEVPNGFPLPEIPDLSIWSQLFADAVIIAVIAFSISVSMACLFGRKHNYTIDSTQELYAYGLSNVLSSFFHCFPSAASLSRSSVLEGAGGKTKLSAFFNAIILLLVILFMGPLFEQLPKACLASIIVVAFKNMILQCKDLVRLWKINKFESVTWFITFVSVVLIDVDYGLVIGLLVSNLLIVVKDQFFQLRTLAIYDDSPDFVDEDFIVDMNPNALNDSNVKIYKIQRSIYFANCDNFQNRLFKIYGFSPIERILNKNSELTSVTINSENPITETSFSNIQTKPDPDIILSFSAVNYIDTNGVKLVQQIVNDFKKINVTVYICEAQDNFIKIAYHMDALKKLDEHIYISIADALSVIQSKKEKNSIQFNNFASLTKFQLICC